MTSPFTPEEISAAETEVDAELTALKAAVQKALGDEDL